MASEELLASIDIGSSKITVLIGELEGEKINVFGHGKYPSAGVRDGHVVNVAKAAEAVSEALEKTQKKFPSEVSEVVVNISDPHLKTINQHREIPIPSKTITKENIDAAIVNASAIVTPTNKRKLKPNVNKFLLNDDPQPVYDPLGMQADFLSAYVHIEVLSSQAHSNLHKTIENSGYSVKEVLLDSQASSKYLLSDTDMLSGVCIVDIGSDTTNFSVFTERGIKYSSVLTIGGDQVSNDISYAFDTSFEEAERLKLEYGYAQIQAGLEDSLIEFEQVDISEKKYLSQYQLIEVIEKSYNNIISQIKQELKEKKFNRVLKAGVVLTGGGSLIKNCEKLFIKGLGIRTKLGKRNTDKISISKQSIANDPTYASAFGLITHLYHDEDDQEIDDYDKPGVLNRIKELASW